MNKSVQRFHLFEPRFFLLENLTRKNVTRLRVFFLSSHPLLQARGDAAMNGDWRQTSNVDRRNVIMQL
jgi:hypothetical protein